MTFPGVVVERRELGDFNVNVESPKLSSFNCNPRKGHMEAVYKIFSYLRKHTNSKIVFDHRRPQYDETCFIEADWKSLYSDVSEDILANKPEPRGIPVRVSLFCDADHAGNLMDC